jgi:ADP-ribose pyrophosphatase YjhB (NUDIX family)
MEKICFEQKDYIFSYRAGAMLWRDGKLLMQRNLEKEGFTLPGGQVSFGEYSQKALARKLMEETGAAVKIGRLAIIAELLFRWKKPCHQINFYYLAELKNADALPENNFSAYDSFGRARAETEFCWLSKEELKVAKIYPRCIKSYLQNLPENIVHLQETDMEE